MNTVLIHDKQIKERQLINHHPMGFRVIGSIFSDNKEEAQKLAEEYPNNGDIFFRYSTCSAYLTNEVCHRIWVMVKDETNIPYPLSAAIYKDYE